MPLFGAAYDDLRVQSQRRAARHPVWRSLSLCCLILGLTSRRTQGEGEPLSSPCLLVARLLSASESLHRCALQLADGAGVHPAQAVRRAPFGDAAAAWAPEDPSPSRRWALMESVDGCTMCTPSARYPGGKPLPVTGARAVTWGAASPSCTLHVERRPSRDALLRGPACGELGGENWKPEGDPSTPQARETLPAQLTASVRLLIQDTALPRPQGGGAAARCRPGFDAPGAPPAR